MKPSRSAKMILPAILVISTLIALLSIFTGTAFAQERQNKRVGNVERQNLSGQYPDNIQKWESLIEQNAQIHKIDPNLIAAVMLQESGGQAEVISSSGAVGLMQVMPRDGIASSFICGNNPCFSNRPTIETLLDPEFNVNYGTRMLANLIDDNEDSLREALYQYGPMDVGYAYADIVLAIYDRYKS